MTHGGQNPNAGTKFVWRPVVNRWWCSNAYRKTGSRHVFYIPSIRATIGGTILHIVGNTGTSNKLIRSLKKFHFAFFGKIFLEGCLCLASEIKTIRDRTMTIFSKNLTSTKVVVPKLHKNRTTIAGVTGSQTFVSELMKHPVYTVNFSVFEDLSIPKK